MRARVATWFIERTVRYFTMTGPAPAWAARLRKG